MLRSWSNISASALAAWMVLMPSIVGASPDEMPHVRVRTTACPDLDSSELERLLALELVGRHADEEDIPTVVIGVRCVEEILQLSVVAPGTGRRVHRELPAPHPDDPARERVVALTLSELFETAWLDLLSAPPGWSDSTTSDEETSTPPAAPPPPAPRRRDEVIFAASARLRHLPGIFPTGRVEVGYGGWLRPSWRLFGLADVEYGGTRRELGVVHGIGTALGAGATYRSPRIGHVTLDISLRGAARYLRLVGVSDEVGVDTGSAQGIAAEGTLTIGPTFAFERTRLGLFVEGGYTAPGPNGRITADDPARMDGGFIGLGLELAVPPRRTATSDRTKR